MERKLKKTFKAEIDSCCTEQNNKTRYYGEN